MTNRELLNEALEQGDGQKLRKLLRDDSSLVRWLSADLSGAIHSAAEKNQAEVIQVLVELGADVNARGFNDWTPLHTAAWNAAPDAAEVLLAKGAHPQAQDIYGYTPLFFATRYNGIPGYAVLGVLLKKGVELDLLSAIELNQTRFVECILICQPCLFQTDPNADDFLPVAVSRGNLDLARLLVERGAKVNTSHHFDLPLTLALSLPSEVAAPIIKYLLAHGADPRLKPAPDKQSPLERAQANALHLLPLLSGES